MPQSQATQPSYAAYAVEGEGKQARWTRIGAVWPHNDGEGFTIHLQALPLNGILTLRKPKTERDTQPQGKRA